jgi:hypothetical protein
LNPLSGIAVMIPLNHLQSNLKITFFKALALSWVLIHFILVPSMAAEVQLTALDTRRNYFSGRTPTVRYRISSNGFFQGDLMWRLAFQGRTLQRGQRAITIQSADLIIGLDLSLPQTKDEVVMPVDLELRVKSNHSEKPVLQTSVRKWVFSPLLFLQRKEEFRRLNIYLFDPLKHTVKIFKSAGIPFAPIYRPETISELKRDFLIIGEGISLKNYRGLADMMIEAASAGNIVLCLKPQQGAIPRLAIVPEDAVCASGVHLHDNSIIRFLDKRLDMDAWSPQGRIAVCGINLVSGKNRIAGDLACDGKGWPWFTLDFEKSGGKFLLCGFGIIEAWNSEPAPRYLFDRIIKYLYKK